MPLFGGNRGRFGMGFVATPQQQAESEAMARRFGLPSDTQQAVDQYAAMPAQQAPQRDWGRGLSDIGTGLMAAQAALDGNFGMSAELSSSIGAEQRRLAKEAEQAHRNRMEWVWRQQYERNNPKPVNNDTVADYEFYKRTLSPEQFQTWLQNRIDPPQYRQGPDGQFYRVSPMTPPAITEDDWNKGQVIGGPAPQAPGGFRR